MGASGINHAPGQVPDPGATAGTSKYLREDGTWATPPNTEYNEATTSTAGLLSAADKTKLNGIETNADVTDAENVKLALSTNSNHGGEFLRKDGTWQVPTLSNSDVGLGNVLNKEQIPVEEKGVANGVATLDSMGKVPSIQLPSYVDDVIELLAITDTAPLTCVKDDKYYNTSSNKIFIATAVNTWDTTGETPEKEKIYVNTSNEKSYRWGGSAMIAVGSSDIEGIKVGSSGSLITPSQGVITIPAYEVGAQVNPTAATPSTSGTGGSDGLLTAQDKEKLNGIESGAQAHIAPTTAEVKSALSTVVTSQGKYLKDDGTWDTPPDTTYSTMGASGSTHASGLVPDTPSTAGTSKYLREDGTWETPPDTTYSAATQSDAGLMSAVDKKKVDNVMNLTNSAITTGSLELAPNTLYSLGALTGALTVTLGTPASGIPNTYMMEFDINDSAATPTKVPSFPAYIVWREEPVWTTGKHYEISIRYSTNTQAYYGMFVEFDTAS